MTHDTKAAEPALPPLPAFHTNESPWDEILEWSYLPMAHPDAGRLADAIDAALGKLMQDYAREAVRVALSASTQAPDAAQLLKAAIDCPHSITSGRVVLTYDHGRPGHNTLNQLRLRLEAALAASPAVERDALLKLARYGAAMLQLFSDAFAGDIDGGTAQDKALEFGVLEPRTVTEPCGQSCECAGVSAFPLECYFMPAAIRSAIAAIANQAPGEPTA